MSVNRKLRDQFAKTIVSYLHKEIDFIELVTATEHFQQTDIRDDTLKKLADNTVLLAQYENAQNNQAICRILAFLTSDLQHKEQRESKFGIDIEQFTALITITFFLIAVYLQTGWLGTMFLYCACGIFLSLLSFITEYYEQMQEDKKYYPFLNKLQWQQHESLISNYNLPQTVGNQKLSWVESAIGYIFMAIASPVLAIIGGLRFRKDRKKTVVF